MYEVKFDGRDCGNCTMATIMSPELFKEWKAGNVLTNINVGNFAELLEWYREENPIETPESWMIDNVGMFVRNNPEDIEAFENYYNDLVEDEEIELDDDVEAVTRDEMSLYNGGTKEEDDCTYYPLKEFQLSNGWGVIMSAHYDVGVLDYGDGVYSRWAKQIEDAFAEHPEEVANALFIQEFVEEDD